MGAAVKTHMKTGLNRRRLSAREITGKGLQFPRPGAMIAIAAICFIIDKEVIP